MPSAPSRTLASGAAPSTSTPSTLPALSILPGLALALGVAVVSMLVAPLLPGISALVLAIVVGVVLANVVPLPRAAAPGLAIASKKLLRAGIVLLGLQVALGDLASLGIGMLLVVVAEVGVGILGTVLLGRVLGVGRRLTLLIACGFSILSLIHI